MYSVKNLILILSLLFSPILIAIWQPEIVNSMNFTNKLKTSEAYFITDGTTDGRNSASPNIIITESEITIKNTKKVVLKVPQPI